ncbi:HIT-like domain-containing protein [Coprinopsis sp. MPI-PUGE-AT-0042]|nr:HIT-like domain-containing protein [Coprinopsis sp. MPI-PUGE-AT-0042]
MSNLTILRQYAAKSADSLPKSVLFQSTSKFYTIFDAYPKSIFHFLILPRILSTQDAAGASDNEGTSEISDPQQQHFTASELRNFKAILKTDRERCKTLLEEMHEEAQGVKKQIEDEMVEHYGFKWDVWIGFHAVPSMEHLHLHVLSADLVSERMKNKKHYNSFHPSLGFFLHISDVLEWFDATPEYFKDVTELNPKKYEGLLKESLACFKCGSSMKNMPTLKEHLQVEWDKQAAKAKAKAKAPATLKRKVEAEPVQEAPKALPESANSPHEDAGSVDEAPSKKPRKD